MNLSYFVAARYLFSKRKTNFINIISILSMGGVAFITAALIIVLSVFNGLEELLASLNNSFDPEIKIQAAKGKSFAMTQELRQAISGVEGVDVVTEVIEDYAYVRYRDANQIVTLKGVSDNFLKQDRIPAEAVVDGKLLLKEKGIHYAVVGKGIQYRLSIAVDEPLYPLQVFYIQDVKSGVLDASKLYSKKNITVSGAFSIVQNFDENYILVPLDFAQDLLQYGDKRTSLEIKSKPGFSTELVEANLERRLGDAFKVLNPQEQHQDLYKLLRMEKLFTFLALALLLLVGSINIFFSLMMLALDKKKDISILSAMGADAGQIKRIFVTEGAMIAFSGAFLGLILGGVFCFLQMKYGIISMGMETAVTQGYPIKVNVLDFIWTLMVVTVITFIISSYPARLASRFAGTNQL